MTAASQLDTTQIDLDHSALEFLGSEFTDPVYGRWPIERRLEIFLRHRGLTELADSGEGFEALLDRVMVNFSTARRAGLFGR